MANPVAMGGFGGLSGAGKLYYCCYAENRLFDSLFRLTQTTQHCGSNKWRATRVGGGNPLLKVILSL